MTNQDFARRLRAAINDDWKIKSRVFGCSSATIEEIENAAGVRLPSIYKVFLFIMGASDGVLQQGTINFYPELLENTPYGRGLLVENNHPLQHNANLFVLELHQGYSMIYFDCGEGHDPAVYGYVEGDEQPEKLEEWLSDYLLKDLPGFFGFHLEHRMVTPD